MATGKKEGKKDNKYKQKAVVFSAFWNGGVEVCVAPPGNVTAALVAACRIANKERGCNVTYIDLINGGSTRIEWGETILTQQFIEKRIKDFKP